ncbi:MAG: PTS sugar transporter subunit IIC, partial [Peptostreptococcus sp.]|nr:PTS sugar transporter subunit IIC [Peptostreptococcus sp.]
MSKNKNSMAWKLFDRYFIQGLNGMALGLFSTLIIGLIIKQISSVFTGSIASFLLTVAVVAMSLTGPVIGIGVAHALKSPKLVILASGVTGLLGAFGGTFSSGALLSDKMQLVLPGAGDPLGAFIAVVI